MPNPRTYITADELFRRIDHTLSTATTNSESINKQLHDTLSLACDGALQDSLQAFGNLFSKVDFLCKRHRIALRDVVAIQQMRRESNKALPIPAADVPYHCRALAIFVSAVYNKHIPSMLVGRIAPTNKPPKELRHVDFRYLRCIVDQCNDSCIMVKIDHESYEEPMVLNLETEEQAYLKPLLRMGMQLNLLDCTKQGHALLPRLVVIEPDFLLDISAIARCFTDYGHHPLAYTVNRMGANANSQAILVGSFAGAALDDIINNDTDYDWRQTFTNTFKERTMDFCTCPDLNVREPFREVAVNQANNIEEIVDRLFDNEQEGFDRSKALLEPSFVCEELGLQGRVDLMTSDFRLLVEQKSGANYNIQRNQPNEYGSFQKEDHYVQLLLYYGVLRHNFRLSNHQVDIRLLYSKYPLPGGLVVVAYLQRLFHEAIRLRNEIVAQEFGIAQQGFDSIIDKLSPDTLNQNQLCSTFYHRYLEPQIAAVTTPLHKLETLERAYVCRMLTFVYNEQMLAKVGAQQTQGHSGADLWNMPLAEKRETGNIFTALKLQKAEKSNSYNGVDTLTFDVPEQADDFLPNFRRGDMVYLYAYEPDAEPDVRQSILFKGVLVDIAVGQIVVHLNDGLQNENYLQGDKHFAIEHATSDVGSTSAVKALHSFATANAQRKALLLGQREPQYDAAAELSRSYHPSYDEVLLRIKQARDYFLLVGPPGTGKTSMALRFIVEEQAGNILLMSYTNRAVDEICDMLLSAEIPFLRIGNEYSCDERFRPFLLDRLVDSDPKLSLIKQRIAACRVFVGTTSTMQSRSNIFALKHFDLAVIDEASQILEPNIVGLLSANLPHDTAISHGLRPQSDSLPAIDKFVLIGDHKQLPAVVQQNAAQAAVNHPQLNAIGITDCRQSLFERLIHWERSHGRTRFIGTLNRQGRMHPHIARFPNEMFYAHERLDVVPCPHQEEQQLDYNLPSQDVLDDQLKAHRLLFFAAENNENESPSDKANLAEARIVARILGRIHRFYGKHFDANRTVGVIVPYRNQIAMIRRELQKLGIAELNGITIDTVERYQGSQRDVIVYSFTITHRYQLYFLTANCFEEDGRIIDRKLNVALTRARKQMIITGHIPTLSHNRTFKALIQHVRENGLVVEECV